MTIEKPILLPDLIGRIAILGGRANTKTTLCLGLAVRQVQHKGTVICLDARQERQIEVQFRLLLRERATYVGLPPTGEVSAEVGQTVLKAVHQGLDGTQPSPPLLLCNSIPEQPDWEQSLSFFLKAGATVVEFLCSASALVFGRYSTVLLLQAGADTADSLSRAVGRKVSPQDVTSLKPGEGILVHLRQIYRVNLPDYSRED